MTNNEAKTIANTTKRQAMMGLMAVGAHQFTFSPDGALNFKCGGRMRYMTIALDASDTYSLEYVRMTRNYERKVLGEISGVYADQLARIVRDLYEGRI